MPAELPAPPDARPPLWATPRLEVSEHKMNVGRAEDGAGGCVRSARWRNHDLHRSLCSLVWIAGLNQLPGQFIVEPGIFDHLLRSPPYARHKEEHFLPSGVSV